MVDDGNPPGPTTDASDRRSDQTVVADGFAGFHHVKIPVTDVARSSAWYQRVLGYRLGHEFVEDGVVMGVALADASETAGLALRLDPERSAVLRGFDPVALRIADPADVERWRDHLDALGETHGGVLTGSGGGTVLVGLRDPDGIEIRLYADPV